MYSKLLSVIKWINIARMTLYAGLTLIPQLLKTSCTMSSFSSGFGKIDVMFLEFVEDLNNLAGGSSSVGDNSGTAQPPRRNPR
ncbi:cytochrome P450 CYP82D47-like [Cucumis melo var. makuwa]|uniref:Cytochrome P450 CYP82D47-like n=1 Tax=Cucumis melo var. makuwa TaxID=1194695 RepID=A0A5A7TNN2_CUCMM|nr:cytochrome P450 CYP82D47-like [Cucumis melo var. makuwa]